MLTRSEGIALEAARDVARLQCVDVDGNKKVGLVAVGNLGALV